MPTSINVIFPRSNALEIQSIYIESIFVWHLWLSLYSKTFFCLKPTFWCVWENCLERQGNKNIEWHQMVFHCMTLETCLVHLESGYTLFSFSILFFIRPLTFGKHSSHFMSLTITEPSQMLMRLYIHIVFHSIDSLCQTSWGITQSQVSMSLHAWDFPSLFFSAWISSSFLSYCKSTAASSRNLRKAESRRDPHERIFLCVKPK